MSDLEDGEPVEARTWVAVAGLDPGELLCWQEGTDDTHQVWESLPQDVHGEALIAERHQRREKMLGEAEIVVGVEQVEPETHHQLVDVLTGRLGKLG